MKLYSYLFAAGDVDSRLEGFNKQFSVDRFFISAGLENFEQKDELGRTIADGIRAFLRNETALGLSLEDTGLFVVNSGSSNTDAQDALLHADFGLEGSGSNQKSTISVTLGQIEYQTRTCTDGCDIQESVEAVVSGQTIGSSRGSITNVDVDGNETTGDAATVTFSSPLRSTAAGGGNPALNRDGYAGYLLLENYDPDPQNFDSQDEDADLPPLLGGTETPLGGAEATQEYAYLRLATATGSSANDDVDLGERNNLSLSGWAAGLAEIENAENIDITQIDTDDTPDNLQIQTNSDTNRVAAQVSFFNHPELTFGGLTGEDSEGASAFVDDNRFAVRTENGQNAEVVLLSGDLVKAGLPADMQAPIREYQHLKWGFFFGDTVSTEGSREHVHLGSWAAGQISDPSDFPSTGSATYSGHAVGNVFNNGNVYTSVGTYNNAWNFGPVLARWK